MEFSRYTEAVKNADIFSAKLKMLGLDSLNDSRQYFVAKNGNEGIIYHSNIKNPNGKNINCDIIIFEKEVILNFVLLENVGKFSDVTDKNYKLLCAINNHNLINKGCVLYFTHFKGDLILRYNLVIDCMEEKLCENIIDIMTGISKDIESGKYQDIYKIAEEKGNLLM